ncbi:MAG: nucleotide sugar dehydrogenase [Candidatus Omnitrophica bacterium]|nr:nucleotide sugar dehydrogenase [Candidatus Omnitrophota bacterium]
MKRLENAIISKKARIGVIGMGYVGLPLALGFVRKGFEVYGIDNDVDRIRQLLEKKSYITDLTDADIVRAIGSKRFFPFVDSSLLKKCAAIIICVPTPIKKRYTPDISFMLSAVRAVAKNLSRGTLVVLESTTYPGTTEELIKPELEKSGLKAGKDFFLAFSPERVDPGNSAHTVTQIPKVVGGLTPSCCRLTKLLYGQIIKHIHVVSSPSAAEMTKLLENTFRIVNIGWVNEAAMMCHKFGIDIWEVIDAAKTKPFGFMPFYPGLGVGGHCIPEDPIYLYWKAKQRGHTSRFIKLSADINSSMPEYALRRLEERLHAQGKKIAGAKVLVFGVTYKKDVKDLRKSPSLRLIELLQHKKAVVSFSDPFVPHLNINGLKMEGVSLDVRTLAAQDCVIIAVDHSRADYKMILSKASLVFDVKNVFKGVTSDRLFKL